MRLFARTLHRKLLLLLMLVALIPSAAGVMYLYWGSIVAVDESVGTFLQERADNVSRLVDLELQQHIEYAEMARDSVTKSAMTEFLPADLWSRFDSVQVFTPDTPNDPDAPPALQKFIQTALKSTTSTQIMVDEVYDEPGKSRLLFGGRVDASTSNVIVCSIASQRMLRFMETGNVGGQALVDIFSNRGFFMGQASQDEQLNRFVIAHYPEIRSRLSGWVRSPRGEAEPYLVGYSIPRQLRIIQREGRTTVDWIVMAQMGLSDLMQLFGQFLWRSFIFGLLLASGLFALSFILARRFVSPIRKLHRSVERLTRGDLASRVELDTDDELEDLAEAFNTMAEALAKSRESLQKEIELVERNAQQIALMNNLAKSIVAAFDYKKLFDSLHPQLRSLVEYDGLAVVLFRSSNRSRVYRVDNNVFVDPAENSLQIRLFCEEHLVASGTSDSKVPTGNFKMETGILNDKFRQFTLVPLRADSGLIGAMMLARKADKPFALESRRTLSQVSQILALAVGHIKLYNRTCDFAEQLELKVKERTHELELIHQRMLHTERFAATGRLAANIAHEINNPLGIVKNYVRLLHDAAKKTNPQGDEILTVVDEELDRIARIVRGLLDFYRPSKVRHEAVQLNDQIGSLLGLMEGSLRTRHIEVITELDPELPLLQTSADHMRQVLLNLLKNAEDAISAEGKITIRTFVQRDIEPPHIILEISDTGSGISTEDLPRIFEPFFTTKKEGHGTGLGLSVTYGIVRNWDGNIEVESSPGRGTTFRVRLPLQRNEVLAEN